MEFHVLEPEYAKQIVRTMILVISATIVSVLNVADTTKVTVKLV